MELQNFDAKGLSTTGIIKKLSSASLGIPETDPDFLTITIVDMTSSKLTKIDEIIKAPNAGELQSIANAIETSKNRDTHLHAPAFRAEADDMVVKTNASNKNKETLKQEAAKHIEDMLKKFSEIIKQKKEKKETSSNEVKNALASLKEKAKKLASHMETLHQETNELQKRFDQTYAKMFAILTHKDKEGLTPPTITPTTTPGTSR